MALREEFESTGNWLFRWRSYLPIVVFGILLLALLDHEYLVGSEQLDNLWKILCLSISFFGLGIRVLTIGYTPAGTSGRNTKTQIAETVNTTGMYSIVRNPLYLGNFFMGLGLALFAHLWWLVLIYILIFWLYYERIIFAEEAYLRRKFGHQYLNWANKTPAFIPKPNQYRKAGLLFSFKNVLRREYNGFFAVVATMFLLKVVSETVHHDAPHIETEWIALISVSFILWTILRSLKKYTGLLDVEGR